MASERQPGGREIVGGCRFGNKRSCYIYLNQKTFIPFSLSLVYGIFLFTAKQDEEVDEEGRFSATDSQPDEQEVSPISNRRHIAVSCSLVLLIAFNCVVDLLWNGLVYSTE